MEPLFFQSTSGRASFAVEYPFASKFMDRHGMRLHYVDEGRGESLVMIHGNPTWSYYYRRLIKAFSPRYRCIALDHLGCGMSDVPSEAQYEYTLASRVDDLTNLLQHLGLSDKLTLVLHDWGGMIGMAYADRHPETVKRIVLFNTAAFPLPKSKPFPWPLWLTRTAFGEWLVLRFNAFSRVAAWVGCTRAKMPPDIRQGYVAPYAHPSRRLATLRFVQDIPLREGDRAYLLVRDVASRLSQFAQVPVLICWGGKDFVFDRHFLEEWERYWPHAEVHRFPAAGHYIVEDQAAEIIPLMERFLAEHPV
jgi:haloalkane dehalogenase